MARAPSPRVTAPEDGPTVPQRAIAPRASDEEWVGRVVGGKYMVESILGRGGMGLVLEARHLRLDEPVAIKVLHDSLAKDPTMTARLLREARAALRLQSDHTVRMLDADVLDNGVPYLVLELLEGVDLATLCKKRGAPMTAEQAVAIADQMCRALAEAHALGIVHRDVKPANLFIVQRPDGRRIVKLLDFGVSRLTRAGEAPVTRPGDIIGSPRYMSPEQVLAGDIDGRSDIWSAGVVLYEMLSGESPFRSDNFARTCQSVVQDTPIPLGAHRPDLPAGLTAVVARCLEKAPAKRFPDAAALREALVPFGPVARRNASQSALPDISDVLGDDPISQARPALSVPENALYVSELSAPGEDAAAGEAANVPDATTLVRKVPSAETDTLATPVKGRRPFVPMALSGLAVGVAVGIGVLSWGTPPPPTPVFPVTAERKLPASVVAPAHATLPAPPAPSAEPATLPNVLPPASADTEPSLDPPAAKSAHPITLTSAKARPRTTVDPFGQQRH